MNSTFRELCDEARVAGREGNPPPIGRLMANPTYRAAYLAGREPERSLRVCPHCGGDITAELDASYEHGYTQGYEKRSD
jgi:hypothetical protein